MTATDMDELDAALCELNPARRPMSATEKAALATVLAAMPPLTAEQCVAIGRVLKRTPAWQAIRAASG